MTALEKGRQPVAPGGQSRGYPPGTVRMRSVGGKKVPHEKQPDGTWVPVQDAQEGTGGMAHSSADMPSATDVRQAKGALKTLMSPSGPLKDFKETVSSAAINVSRGKKQEAKRAFDSISRYGRKVVETMLRAGMSDKEIVQSLGPLKAGANRLSRWLNGADEDPQEVGRDLVGGLKSVYNLVEEFSGERPAFKERTFEEYEEIGKAWSDLCKAFNELHAKERLEKFRKSLEE